MILSAITLLGCDTGCAVAITPNKTATIPSKLRFINKFIIIKSKELFFE
jgi:hypothetical protein